MGRRKVQGRDSVEISRGKMRTNGQASYSSLNVRRIIEKCRYFIGFIWTEVHLTPPSDGTVLRKRLFWT